MDAATKERTIKQIAADLAPDLDRLVKDYLASDMIPDSREFRALELFLWDNKIGMLRVLQHVCSSCPQERK